MSTLPEGTDKFNSLFKDIPLTIVPPLPFPLVTVKSTDSVATAIRTLANANVLSAPCLDVEAEADDSWLRKYTGTVDTVNFLYWLLDKVDEKTPETLEALLKHDFAASPVSDVLGKDPDQVRFAPFIPMDPERNNMLDAMLVLGKYGVHRLFVVESGGDIVNVITQSRIVAILNNHADSLLPTIDMSLNQLGLAQQQDKPPVFVQEECTFWDAFKIIRKHNVNGLPVVNDVGEVQGCVSTRDARLLITRPTMLHFLSKPLSLFAELRKEPFSVDILTAKADESLRSVIKKLATSHLHRIFVVDESKKLIRVISLRDIIACFVKEPSDGYMSSYFTI